MPQPLTKAPSPLRSAVSLQRDGQRQRLAAEFRASAERERGSVTHEAPDATGAVILASGTYGGVDGPSGIYLGLAERLKESGINSIRLDYQQLNTLEGCVRDVQAALEVLASKDIERVVLVGWSFGGAVVANAAVTSKHVVGVAMIASQQHRAEAVAQISPRRLLLIHGTADTLLPADNSMALFAMAREPKELSLVRDADHFFTHHSSELTDTLFAWCSRLAGLNELVINE